MIATLTFENEGGKTRYTARVRHWTVADREAHERMGFQAGWGQCADQFGHSGDEGLNDLKGGPMI